MICRRRALGCIPVPATRRTRSGTCGGAGGITRARGPRAVVLNHIYITVWRSHGRLYTRLRRRSNSAVVFHKNQLHLLSTSTVSQQSWFCQILPFFCSSVRSCCMDSANACVMVWGYSQHLCIVLAGIDKQCISSLKVLVQMAMPWISFTVVS